MTSSRTHGQQFTTGQMGWISETRRPVEDHLRLMIGRLANRRLITANAISMETASTAARLWR